MNSSQSLRQIALLVSAPILCVCIGAFARGDVFELTNGGRIEGLLIDGDDKANYVIETVAGRVTVARDQVERIESTSDAERQYKALVRNSPNTVDAHWALYEWCRDHKLRDRAQQHLTQLLELDPDHDRARSILGFKKNAGDWMTQEQIMASRGLVHFEGRYRTPQEVTLLERRKEAKALHFDWKKDLERLRRNLTNNRYPDRAAEALKEIQAIDDPLAADPLVALLRKETDPALFRLWLEVVSRLNSPSAVNVLIEYSLFSTNAETRYQCLDYLLRSGRPGMTAPYLRQLNSSDNKIINRAAMALGKIGDPDAIGPLIDVLVSNHKVQIGSGDAGQMGVRMSPTGGGGGLSMGSGPQFKSVPVRNPDVLTALVSLTRITGFEYDQVAWRAWLATQARRQQVDLRRDE